MNPGRNAASESLQITALTRRMCAGDETAYRIFYDAYFNRLSRYLLVVSAGNEDAMREALQRTLQRVVRHIRKFDDEETFWSWLTVLARSAHADERKKRRRYLAFLDRFTRQTEVASDVLLSSADGDEALADMLATSVAALPEDERRLIEWKYTECRGVREIAASLGTSEKAVESRLGRVRLKLKVAVLTALRHEALH